MGSLELEYLQSLEPVRPVEEALFGTGQVGGLAVQDTTTAMCVERMNDQLLFTREVEIHVATRSRTITLGASSAELSWRRWEVKTAATPELRKGVYLLLAEHPWGGGWFQDLPMRPRTRKSKGLLSAQLGIDPSLDAVVREIEALDYDPFETNRNVLTASQTLRSSDSIRARDPDRAKARHVFGLSLEPPKALMTQLFETPKVQELLRLTKANRINYSFLGQIEEPKPPPPLAPMVIEDRGTLMTFALGQALAGPPDDEGHPSGEWLGRPVVQLAEHIYKNHLNNANRREYERTKKEVAVSAEYFDKIGHQPWQP